MVKHADHARTRVPLFQEVHRGTGGEEGVHFLPRCSQIHKVQQGDSLIQKRTLRDKTPLMDKFDRGPDFNFCLVQKLDAGAFAGEDVLYFTDIRTLFELRIM